jgi:homoserine/homoserine lactone efflux protein
MRMSVDTWLLFCATDAVLSATPGPAVLLVVSLSLTRGGAAGLRASLGILAANAAYFVLSATGLGAALLASWELFSLIRWLGAAYLVWLGLRMISAALRTQGGFDQLSVPTLQRRRVGAFSQAFIAQAANPKLLLYFTAILPQFIHPAVPIARQVAILGVSSVAIEFVILGIYVLACRAARRVASPGRFATPLQITGGSLLVTAGVRLAALRHE